MFSFFSLKIHFAAWESLSLEEAKNHGDVALRDMVSGHGRAELVIELDDLGGLFQP